ncbi:unnamed protein product [Adineta steineri]|uniref:Transposase domain-containing protein n=1 Tax=Adineta steineri TaxID=433720 RepID=A0A814WPT5_9BILA|nr:unnamed protein product [Adineta steineri]CAF1478106.1 unnamed protein product [Adineta steineri]
MNNNVFESILLSKQLQQKKLLKQNRKRRALISTRRIRLDTTYTNVSSTSSNILDEFTESNFTPSNIYQHILTSDIDNGRHDKSNELNNHPIVHDSLSELNNISITDDDDNDSYIEAYDSNDSDEFNVLNDEKYLYENFDYNLNSCFTLLNQNLHNWTNISTQEFCAKLLRLLRDAKICKSQTDKLIQLIYSGLPTPNNMPKSMKQILAKMQVQELFSKSEVCAACYMNINDHHGKICSTTGLKNINIFDTHVKTAFLFLLNRLWSTIKEYKQQISLNTNNNYNDIPFNILYRKMVKNMKDKEFISIMLHVDGISICKSKKMKLWLLSGVIIELPPHLRYRRCNMILLSIYIGTNEPKPKPWLKSCFFQLHQIKNEGVVLSNGIRCRVLFYSIIGDCPALKMILEFIAHNGYFCCFYCYIHGIHVGGAGGKRQYFYEDGIQLRDPTTYALESIKAAETSKNVYGHLGRSILHDLLDVPLPYSIISDYLHCTLLRHTRVIVKQIYKSLSPQQRSRFDDQLRTQKFPHTFNRKLRPVSDFAFIKGTELKNLLLYGLLPNLLPYLYEERLGHIALFVCFIRLLHGKKIFGEHTSAKAKELFIKYYENHGQFFDNVQDFTLHVHLHFDRLFDQHGSLCHLATFGQEDFIGSVSKNFHGTRFHGELITYYYEIDFALRNIIQINDPSTSHGPDGPFDQAELTLALFNDINQHHLMVCSCNKPYQCIQIFRRCMVDKKIYHSLIYSRRKSSVSYFVQYRQNQYDNCFGKIKFFFTINNENYAVIENHEVKTKFSQFFKSSSYYNLLAKTIDYFFFVLCTSVSSIQCVSLSSIENYCIVFENIHHFIVTPLSIDYEHD